MKTSTLRMMRKYHISPSFQFFARNRSFHQSTASNKIVKDLLLAVGVGFIIAMILIGSAFMILQDL